MTHPTNTLTRWLTATAATLTIAATTLTVAATMLAAAAPAAAADAPAGRPNIVFLLTDDQRWDTLGCMGNSIIATPNIDRLSQQGVTFDQAFVTTAICMTNRACIFTGQYAARHGVISFRTNFTPEQLAQTYPGQLKAAGYRIGFIGKWGVGQPPNAFFDYGKGFPGQSYYRQKIDAKPRHLTSIMGDQAIEFLDAADKDTRPFCLAVSFKAPHVQDQDKVNPFHYDPALEHLYQDATIPVPETADPKYFEQLPEFLKVSENRIRWKQRFATPQKYQESVKAYYRLISGVDVVVGRVVQQLKQLKLDANTVIIYSSDHGFYLGEYGLAGKWYAHEVSIRVPLIVFDPRLAKDQRGTRRDQVVLSIDIAPTILGLAGVQPPARMQGQSLVPLVRGKQPTWRTEFFYEHLANIRTIPRSEGVRTPHWKYMRFLDSQPLYEQLYDLQDDPHETRDLATDPKHGDDLAMMRRKWQDWHERAK